MVGIIMPKASATCIWFINRGSKHRVGKQYPRETTETNKERNEAMLGNRE